MWFRSTRKGRNNSHKRQRRGSYKTHYYGYHTTDLTNKPRLARRSESRESLARLAWFSIKGKREGALMARSKNEIRSIQQLPIWFNIKNYEGTEEFGLQEWSSALTKRIEFLRYISFLLAYKNVDFWNDSDSAPELLHELEQMRVNPLDLPEKRQNQPKFTYDSQQMRTVREMTFSDLYYAILWANKSNQKNTSAILKLFDQEKRSASQLKSTQLLNFDWSDWSGKPILENQNTPEFTPLVVDLSLPKTTLLEAFERWLDSTVSEKNIEQAKRFAESDFKKWHEYRVLPYLDLYIWEKQTRNKIPLRVYANAFYPDGSRGEANLKTTTLVHAREFLEGSVLSELKAQATHEQRQLLAKNRKD